MHIKKIHKCGVSEKSGLKAEGKDRIIQDILDAIPENGEWDGESEEFVADSMRAIIRAGLGRAARITGQHVGDDDPCRYDVDFDYDGCKCTLRAIRGSDGWGTAYMDLYVQDENDAFSDAWGPEDGIKNVSSFADTANGLCAKVKAQAEAAGETRASVKGMADKILGHFKGNPERYPGTYEIEDIFDILGVGEEDLPEGQLDAITDILQDSGYSIS